MTAFHPLEPLPPLLSAAEPALICTATPPALTVVTVAGQLQDRGQQLGRCASDKCSSELPGNKGTLRLLCQWGDGVVVLRVLRLGHLPGSQVGHFYFLHRSPSMGGLKSAVAIFRRMVSINPWSRLLAKKIDETTAGASERDQDSGKAAAC